MIVTLAGHVDHGKTAIVHALTGTNTDRLKEEQERGLTIDLGFAYATMADQRIGFVDVPGHHRFIHNMIAGVATQQHALLVIAADDGIMPQTIEHAQILQLLGITSGTIALNKVDLVSTDDLQARRDEIASFQDDGFLQKASVFELAAPNGLGIEALRTHLIDESRHYSKRDSDRPFRMAIDRSFSLRGVGTVVTGTVSSGVVNVGDDLHLTSTEGRVRVRNLNVQGLDADIGKLGDRCSLNITGEADNRAERGDWLLATDSVLPVSNVNVKLSVLHDFPRKIRHWAPVHVYHLTDHSEAQVALLESNSISPGEEQLAELRCDEAMHFKAGDRLLLRDRDLSRTLGGATVLGIVDESIARRRNATNVKFLHALANDVIESHFIASIQEHVRNGLVNKDAFARFSLCTQAELQKNLDSESIEQTSEYALGTQLFQDATKSVFDALRAFHKQHPTRPGMSLDELNREIPMRHSIVGFTLDRLVEKKQVNHVAGQYALLDHHPQKPLYDKALLERIRPMLDSPQPTSLGDVAKQLSMPFAQIEKALRPMVAANALVQITKNRYLLPTRVNELEELATNLASNAPFTVKEFRDASGLGRNMVIDVLEYFDKQRITQRQGDTRVMLTRR